MMESPPGPLPEAPARLRVAGLRSAHAGPFDFALPRGSCLAVTGPSGAGKSLMLRMIADLDPAEGERWLDGRPCTAMSGPAWRASVVYCAAESGWWLDRVGEHFRTPPVPLAAQLGLRPDIFDQAVASCSTGERQRLALLRAFERQPLVLLLDEPTGALDRDSIAQVELLLTRQLAAGMTLVLVTHDADQAGRLGSVFGRLVAGRLTVASA